LANAAHVLVQIAGGPGMTLSEVEILMHELGRHVNDQTQILFGTAVDGRMGNRLSVTIISSLAADSDSIQQTKPAQSNVSMPPVWEQPQEPPPKIDIIPEPAITETRLKPADLVPIEQPTPAAIEPPPPVPVAKKPASAPQLIVPKKKQLPIEEAKPVTEKSVQAKQEVLQFEPVTRGRFEKSEPTIVEGQDLDVPTFLRKNIRVK
jgi:cell division protein FtsZ